MPIYHQAPSCPHGANSSNSHYQRMLVSVVASPRFEAANLSQAKSGETRHSEKPAVCEAPMSQFQNLVDILFPSDSAL
jgi:hypothetical protein